MGHAKCEKSNTTQYHGANTPYESLAAKIFALRSDMVSVTSVSPNMSPESSFDVRKLGIQPLTLPPWHMTVRAI